MKYARVLVCLGIGLTLWVSPVPVMADAIPPAVAKDVQLIGQYGGASYTVAVQGDYAYVGVGPRLAVLDISDPPYIKPITFR